MGFKWETIPEILPHVNYFRLSGFFPLVKIMESNRVHQQSASGLKKNRLHKIAGENLRE